MRWFLIVPMLCGAFSVGAEQLLATPSVNTVAVPWVPSIEVVALNATSSATGGCATCKYVYNRNDCRLNTILQMEECMSTWHQGEECTSPPGHEDGCYRCESVVEYQDSCDDIPDEYSSHYSIIDFSSMTCLGVQTCDDVTPQLAGLVQEAIMYIESGNAKALDDVIARSDGRIVLNEERSAVQAFGCSRTVDLHATINQSFLDELSALSRTGGELRDKRHVPAFAAMGLLGIVVIGMRRTSRRHDVR